MRRLAFVVAVVALAAFPASAEFIEIELPDGADLDAYLYKPSGKGPYPGVIVLHHSVGLTTSIQSFSHDLRDKDFVTLAIEYTSGGGLFDTNVVAAYDYLQTLPMVDSRRIAMVGFSKGARLGLDFIYYNEDPLHPIRAFVSYYVGNTLNAAPAPKLPPVLFLHGGADPGVDASMITTFCEIQMGLGGVCEAKIYEAVLHAFIRTNSNHYNGPATADAFKRTVAFLNKYVRDAPIP